MDGARVAAQGYPGPGAYKLETKPIRPMDQTAEVEIQVDRTFSAPPDTRELGIVLTGVGFAR